MNDPLDEARSMRRSILGEAYVDSQTAEPDATLQDFQDHLTRQAWGAWARRGALSARDRSLLVLAMTAATGRIDEFKLHAGAQPQTGVTDDELHELLFMIAGYCGAPAGLSAKRALTEMRRDRRQP